MSQSKYDGEYKLKGTVTPPEDYLRTSQLSTRSAREHGTCDHLLVPQHNWPPRLGIDLLTLTSVGPRATNRASEAAGERIFTVPAAFVQLPYCYAISISIVRPTWVHSWCLFFDISSVDLNCYFSGDSIGTIWPIRATSLRLRGWELSVVGQRNILHRFTDSLSALILKSWRENYANKSWFC